MKLIYILLLPLFVFSCSKKTANYNTNPDPLSSGGMSVRYLALGDSYTIGQGVQQHERFPFSLTSSLKASGIDVKEPTYIATTGWTSGNLLNAIAAANPPAEYDIVTLLIGVNDQYQGRDTISYRNNFTQLISEAVRLAKGRKNRVFILSIPDYSVTPFVSQVNKERVRIEIDYFSAINKRITEQNNIAYINITPSTREAANDLSLLAQDGLHYSAKEHQRWVNMLLPLVKEQLK